MAMDRYRSLLDGKGEANTAAKVARRFNEVVSGVPLDSNLHRGGKMNKIIMICETRNLDIA